MMIEKMVLVCVGLLLLASTAAAESRTVLVQAKYNQENKSSSISIYSDERVDRKTAATVDEAVKAIGQMKGWGSLVGVYVVADSGFPRVDRKKLFGAIDDNSWLDLRYFGREVPQQQREYFLKETSLTPADAAVSAVKVNSRPGARLLTPDNMAQQGFQFECRFIARTIKEGTNPARPTGTVEVQVFFDSEKGPTINEMKSARLVVMDGDKVLLVAPIELGFHPKSKSAHVRAFAIHRDLLRHAQLRLEDQSEGNHLPYAIDLQSFAGRK